MKEFFRNITQDKTIISAFLINGFLIISGVFFILFYYHLLPPFIPIFNQLPWGEQRLGTTITIFIPLLVALTILITNLLISAITYGKTPLVARMLAAISLLTSILTFLFVIKTVILIT
ncbi:MAG: hypothetical protein Q7K54_03975 [Candidatus Parcubacteria bacterium]|nr:hypothetical protein [Candidatus Parcubacteria bacterium]